MNAYILLALSVVSEVIGSSLLKITDGFKRWLPTLGVIFGYGLAFYGLSLSLKTLPLGLSYAIWAGLGTALTALAGIILYKEKMNKHTLYGLVFIIGGIVLMNLGETY